MGYHARPVEVIGLELRVAFTAMGLGAAPSSDNSFWLRKCRALCLRPAVEPLLLAHWSKLRNFEMSEEQVANLCSLLHGSKQQARTRHSYGLWDNVRFEAPELARRWWEDIQAAANEPELAPLLPAYAFARTIIAHPYTDGNGRLARALVHASLARTAAYAAPFLPLAPAFYMHGAKLAGALRELSASGNWEQFAAVFRIALNQAVTLAEQVRSH